MNGWHSKLVGAILLLQGVAVQAAGSAGLVVGGQGLDSVPNERVWQPPFGPDQVAEMPPLGVDLPFLNPLVPPPLPAPVLSYTLDVRQAGRLVRRKTQPPPTDGRAGQVLQAFSTPDEASRWLGDLAAEHARLAISKGVDPIYAARMGATYNRVLAHLLESGVPMEEALARAEQAFQLELNQPRQDSPVLTAAKDLVFAGADSNSQVGELSGARSVTGAETFDAALSSALARGLALPEALAEARMLSARHEQLLAAEAQNAQLPFASSEPSLPAQSPAVQTLFRQLIAKGYPPERAMQRAQALATPVAGAESVEARLSRGQAAVEGDESALALQLMARRGLTPAQAGQRVSAVVPIAPDTALDRLARGEVAHEDLAAVQVLQHLPRGQRQRVGAAPAPQAESLAELLAAGRAGAQLPAKGNVPFDQTFDRAVHAGHSPAQALQLAQRMAQAVRFRYRLPPAWRKILARPGDWRLTQADGAALPGWLSLEPHSGTLNALQVPEGGLPLTVLLHWRGQQRVVVHDGNMPAPVTGR